MAPKDSDESYVVVTTFIVLYGVYVAMEGEIEILCACQGSLQCMVACSAWKLQKI